MWNPYGILDYTADRSSQIAIKALSYTYPKNAQSEYVVILLQDDLRIKSAEQNFEWPVSTDMHARLLAKLNALNPLMIFSDIIYTRTAKIECLKRPNCKGRLAQSFERINRKNIPFYIASGEHVEGAHWLNDQPTLPTNWNVENNTMPLLNVNENESYPLFRMYQLWCQYKNRNSPNNCPDVHDFDVKETFGPPLIIRWGKENSINPEDKLLNRYRTRFNAVKFGFNNEIDANSELSIPWLSAADVIWPNAQTSAELKDLITGKVVFIGLNIDGLGDKIFNPINGYVPAVFAHAMGFDNLVQYKENYWRIADVNITSWPFVNQLIQQAPTIISIFVAFSAFKLFEYRIQSTKSHGFRHKPHLIFSFIVLLAIPILLLIWEITTKSQSVDWLVFFTFLLLIFSLILASIWFVISLCLNITSFKQKGDQRHFLKKYTTQSLFLASVIYVSFLCIGLAWWYLIERLQYPSYNIVAVSVSAIWLLLNSIVEMVVPD